MDLAYQLTPDGKQTLQALIDRFKMLPKTGASYQQIVPPSLVQAIEARYDVQNIEAIWPILLQTISLQIILEAIRYAPIGHADPPGSLISPIGHADPPGSLISPIGHADPPGFLINPIRQLNRDSILAGYRSVYTSTYPITYKFSGSSGLNHAMMAAILNANGFVEVGAAVGRGSAGINEGDGLGIIFLEYNPGTSKFTKADTLLKCVIKNLLADTKQVIVNKELLYGAMWAENPAVTTRTMAATRKLTPDVRMGGSKLNTWEELKPLLGEVAIVRPVGAMACCGRGISVVTNERELQQARLLVKPYASAIISTYIPNPLLWQGRKFHIRMYLLIRAGTPSIPYHYELWTRGKILTALLPYQRHSWDQGSRLDQRSDTGSSMLPKLGGSETTSHSWNNKSIHDTHSDTTPHNLWFPEDLPDINRRQEIYNKMMESIDVVGAIMRKHVTMYPESIYAYEVFGCDFLVTDTYAVYLLEINDHVGFKPVREPTVYTHNELTTTYYRDGRYTYDDFSFDYYTWVAAHSIFPIYFPHAAIPTPPDFGIRPSPSPQT